MNRTINEIPAEIKEHLQQVNLAKIFDRRLSRKIGVVLKMGNNYYLYNFSGDRSIEDVENIFGEHLCCTCDFDHSGKLCPKIADVSVETARKYNHNEFGALEESKRIEKYDFITLGVECFNTAKEYFIVSECSKYRRNKRIKNKNQL